MNSKSLWQHYCLYFIVATFSIQAIVSLRLKVLLNVLIVFSFASSGISPNTCLSSVHLAERELAKAVLLHTSSS